MTGLSRRAYMLLCNKSHYSLAMHTDCKLCRLSCDAIKKKTFFPQLIMNLMHSK